MYFTVWPGLSNGQNSEKEREQFLFEHDKKSFDLCLPKIFTAVDTSQSSNIKGRGVCFSEPKKE